MIRYQITDGSAERDEEAWFARLRGDVDFIQIRERDLTARQLARLVRRAMAKGPRVLVNDRMDVAIACGAAGMHLRGEAVGPEVIRRIAPPGFLISVACHSAADVERARGAAYAILAPIFHPRSKAGSGKPLGLDELRLVCRNSPVPVIALGGITETNAAQCVEAGAAGVAGIGLFA